MMMKVIKWHNGEDVDDDDEEDGKDGYDDDVFVLQTIQMGSELV